MAIVLQYKKHATHTHKISIFLKQVLVKTDPNLYPEQTVIKNSLGNHMLP